jgi:4-amino-4-deoxy-L-arabinose transferase-like glycosyltransferase
MRRALYAVAAALLFALFVVQLWLHATRTSATIDEPTHLLAGYRYLTCGDFTINREHPPLLKLVAALPLLAMSIKDPLGPCGAAPSAHAVGLDADGTFVLANGIDRVVLPARAAAMVFSLALAALVFAAAREMFGPAEGLIALAVVAFEPALIAHGSLITNDMALTATLFATMFALHRYRVQPSTARLVLIGIAAGLALASKHSGVIVVPLLVLFLWRRVRACAVVLGLAAVVLFATYGFQHWQAYFDGFGLLLAHGERTMYLFDRVYPEGRWFYFPVVFSIKASLALLVMLPFAFASRRPLLLVPPMLFLAVSMFAGLNIGVRHILPIWPFLIVAGAGGMWAFARSRRAAQIVLGALLLFHAVSAATTAPSYIAFANELWGGTSATHRILKDSNVEWGQNLKIARVWLAREGVRDCWFAAYGHGALTAAQQPCHLLPALGWSAAHLVDAVPPVLDGTVLLSATVLPPRGGPEYAPITSTKPIAILGGSILVYRGTFRVPLLSAITHATRAVQLAQAGRSREALEDARMAMQLAPNDWRAQRAWAVVMAAARNRP